ncbi:acyl-CoA dehydrogenase [Acidovorax sp. LjRoot66]|uniref:acyl-CoA dehydrogenase family protein n=1 Tax=Acidovorax sp. LjRoot66 TaxID=3342334 RepID=UPI003ECDAF59
MRFAITEQQQLVQDSALHWLRENYGFHQRASGVHREGGHPQAWQAFAELGWLALPLAEDVGGLEGEALTVGLLAQALGAHLVVEPYVAQVALALRALDRCAAPAQRAAWLPALVAGHERLAWAHAEPGDATPFAPRACTAMRQGEGWMLRGMKQAVRGAGGAAHWLVSASGGDGGPLLLRVPAGLPGVRVDAYETSDGALAADLYFDTAWVPTESLVGEQGASAALDEVLAFGMVAACWQATGTMQAALAQTRRYTADRQQFGQALAQFQVVQHRIAEMAVLCTEAQAACELAAMRLELARGEVLHAVAAAVRSKVVRAAGFVARECVQLHGAMGVCEELPIAASFRCLLAFEAEDGSADTHARWLGRHALDSQRHTHSQTLGEH